jgi:hypothetical protein
MLPYPIFPTSPLPYGSFIASEASTIEEMHWDLAALSLQFGVAVALARQLKAGVRAMNPANTTIPLRPEETGWVLDWLRTKVVSVQEVQSLRNHSPATRALLWEPAKRQFVEKAGTTEYVTVPGLFSGFSPSDLTLLVICVNDDALAHDPVLSWLMKKPADRKTWATLAKSMRLAEVLALARSLSAGIDTADPVDPTTTIPQEKVKNVMDWLRHNVVCVKETRALRNSTPKRRDEMWTQVELVLTQISSDTQAIPVPGVFTALALSDLDILQVCGRPGYSDEDTLIRWIMSPLRVRTKEGRGTE